ncbi:hypothetical protein VTP01DRAFT_4585 [Rhizomucor pusillus]|uniref:uncharacterized protein n=1 Tax=Rhizomucor pusillus TaxID=4840 RepID=UPI003744A723
MGELDYSKEPKRDASLLVRKDKPFNAEPRVQDLVKHYITPEALMFCRSHGPIPTHLDENTHTIIIQGPPEIKRQEWLLRDIKKRFEKVNVMAAMQCAGNRRDGLHKVKHTKGVIWGPAAIGNAVYSGCRLRDVLIAAGAGKLKNIGKLHVAFESVEECEEDKCYGSSIPLSKALDEFGDVLLAYEMNHKPLTPDHGYPVRAVVPGYIGARSVKFLKSITIQDHESNAYYQRRDYKILPEQVTTEEQAQEFWCKVPSIGEYNVQSFVCEPPEGVVASAAPKAAVVAQGYALSGGGRSIQRVDVSGDDGKTWVLADLYQPSAAFNNGSRIWSWCLWTARVEVMPGVRIVCRAVDSSGNIQQEFPVWNYRGVMNNSWRTVETNSANL